MSDQSSESPQLSLSNSSSTSDCSEQESVSSSRIDHAESRQRWRKRKARSVAEDEHNGVKRPSPYLPAYHELVNATIAEISQTSNPAARYDNLKDGRIGLSWWTASEKEAFFIALGRRGSLDIRGISRVIGSKSEPEVQVFILDLQKACIEEEQRGRTALLDYSDHPAAFEITAKCEQTLEAAAKGLAFRQLASDEATEKARHGSSWLLNLTNCMIPSASSERSSGASSLENAIGILNVKNMLILSCRVFMNSSHEDGSWKCYYDDGVEPAIYATALIDLYNLLLGITKRVVASTIFLAESRSELQMQPSGRKTGPVIGVLDVRSACELLGLRGNWHEYWTKVSRRCQIEVVDEAAKPISYSQVEQALGEGSYASQHRERSSVDQKDDLIDITTLALLHDGQSLVDDEEDERAEKLDATQSQEEESRLWEILGQAGKKQGPIKTEDMANELPSRRSEQPMRPWQERLSYKAQWQLSGGVPSEQQFLALQMQQANRNAHRKKSSTSGDFRDSTVLIESAGPATGGLDASDAESHADLDS